MKAKVVNLMKESYDIYIGRGSKWGNPFKVGVDGNRREVIEKYEKWFLYSDEAEHLRGSINELHGKILGCYCHPKKCHGDFLLKISNKF